MSVGSAVYCSFVPFKIDFSRLDRILLMKLLLIRRGLNISLYITCFVLGISSGDFVAKEIDVPSLMTLVIFR